MVSRFRGAVSPALPGGADVVYTPPFMWLGCARWSIRIREVDATTRALLSTRWPEFLLEGGAPGCPTVPDVTLDVRAHGSLQRGMELPGPPDLEVRQEGSRYRFRRADFDGTWDEATSTAQVTYASELHFLASFLRVLLAFVLSRRRGGLLHASSVRVGGGVLLFPGASGTGKSTIAKLAAPRGVLSDEITCVDLGLPGQVEGRPVASPTPFWGELPRERADGPAPLLGIVLLRRGLPMVFEPAQKAEALAILMHCLLSFGLDASRKRDAFRTMADLVERVPCMSLRYSLPEDPWSLLEPFALSA